MKPCHQLILVNRAPAFPGIEEVARISGMHPGMIEVFLCAHIIHPCTDGNGIHRFDPGTIERLCQIQRMRKGGRPVLRSIRLVCALTDRLAEAEREIEGLRSLHSGR